MKKLEDKRVLWQQLLQQKTTNGDLRYIIAYVEPLRTEAEKRIQKTKEEIMEEIKSLS